MNEPYISVLKVKKKHKLIFLIISFIPIVVCIISLFLPLYSKTDWVTGETMYFNSFILGLETFENPDGYFILGAIILNIISITIIILIDNIKNLRAIYIWEVILWLITGGLIFFTFWAFAFVGSDTIGFSVIPEIGSYLRHISWLLLGIPLLYFGVILFLLFRNNVYQVN